MNVDLWRQQGLRLTPQRQLILQLLEQLSGHVAPEDIYQRVHQQFPMVNRSTVYRTLEVLEDLGLARHTHDGDGATRYHVGGEPLHLHLYCHNCGHLAEVDDVSVADSLTAALKDRYGFVADPSHFAVSGLCATCATDLVGLAANDQKEG